MGWATLEYEHSCSGWRWDCGLRHMRVVLVRVRRYVLTEGWVRNDMRRHIQKRSHHPRLSGARPSLFSQRCPFQKRQEGDGILWQ